MSCIEPDRNDVALEVVALQGAILSSAINAAVRATDIAALMQTPDSVWVNPVLVEQAGEQLRAALASLRHAGRKLGVAV